MASIAMITREEICRFISHEARTNPRKSRRLHAIRLIAVVLHGSLSLHPCLTKRFLIGYYVFLEGFKLDFKQSVDEHGNVSCGGLALMA